MNKLGLGSIAVRSLLVDFSPTSDRRTRSEAQRSMWEREMERAETDAWFKQPVSADDQRGPASSASVDRSENVHVPQVAELSLASDAATSRVSRTTRSEAARYIAGNVSTSMSKPYRPSTALSSQPAPVASIAPTSGSSPSIDQTSRGRIIRDGAREVALTIEGRPQLPGGGSMVSNSAGLATASVEAAAESPSRGEVSSAAPAGAAGPPVAGSPAWLSDAAGPDAREALVRGAMAPLESDAAVPPREGADLRKALQIALADLTPVRMYIERAGASASVWLGTDKDMTAHLPGLIASVTDALSRHGVRLRSVVCNGVRRYDAVDAGAESTSDETDLCASGSVRSIKFLDINLRSET